MSLNYDVAKMAFQQITQCPLAIRNLLLVANCRDIALNVKAGSNFIWLPYTPSPLELSIEEKCIMVAEIIKTLNLRIGEVMIFLKGA